MNIVSAREVALRYQIHPETVKKTLVSECSISTIKFNVIESYGSYFIRFGVCPYKFFIAC